MLRLSALALAAVATGLPALAQDVASAPPPAPFQAVSALVKLPDFLPGLGQLFVDPATLMNDANVRQMQNGLLYEIERGLGDAASIRDDYVRAVWHFLRAKTYNERSLRDGFDTAYVREESKEIARRLATDVPKLLQTVRTAALEPRVKLALTALREVALATSGSPAVESPAVADAAQSPP